MKLPDDFYINDDYWQEYDCPRCGGDFDIDPPQRPGTEVHCCHCGHEWLAPAHSQGFAVVPESDDHPSGMEFFSVQDMS